MVLILHVLSHVALRRESKPATRFTMSQVFTLDVGLGTLVILRSLGWGGFWEVGRWGTASVPSGSAFFGMTSQSWGTIAHGQQNGKKWPNDRGVWCCFGMSSPSSPGPGHGTLHGVRLWEVVPGEAVHLQPVGALVTPLVFLLTGDVQVARRLGAVTHGRFLQGEPQSVNLSRDFGLCSRCQTRTDAAE